MSPCKAVSLVPRPSTLPLLATRYVRKMIGWLANYYSWNVHAQAQGFTCKWTWWSNEDIEAAISAAFSQLGYPVVRQNSWRPRESLWRAKTSSYQFRLAVESRYAMDASLLFLLQQSWHGLQGFRGSTVTILNTWATGLSGWRCSHHNHFNCSNYTDCWTTVFHTYMYFAPSISPPYKS